MNTPTLASKVLRGEADAAGLAAIRLELEFDRKYIKDPVGLKWVQKHLNTIRVFLEHIDQPLTKAMKTEQMMKLTGIANFTSASVKERIDFLTPLYEKLLEQEEYERKRRVIAKLVPPESRTA